jgi:beta-galactosidase
MIRHTDKISLDGLWKFKLDPENIGETDEWYLPGSIFRESINVPGAWNAQGYGDETDRLKSGFAGKAWYKRSVFIRSKADYPIVWLNIGGAHRYCSIYINGCFAGEHIAYTTPFRINITPMVELNKENDITIRVDSKQRKEIDRLKGTFDAIDFMELEWGGLYRSVEIGYSADIWVEDLHVVTDINLKKVTFEVEIINSNMTSDVLLECTLSKDDYKLVEIQSVNFNNARNTVSVEFILENPLLWSPEQPELYKACVKLYRNECILEEITERFGFKKFEIRDKDFYLNNIPYFIRGYGDDCIYPLTICPNPDKAYFVNFIKLVKSFGFNAVRHHSCFPYPEYFEAADEQGLLIQPELPICSVGELKNLNKAARNLFISEWAKLIKLNRNHPSVMAYSMGNELFDGFYFEKEMYDIAKKLDPERLVIGSCGMVGITGVTRFDMDRDTVDYIVAILCQQYILPYGENKDILSEELYEKPIIVHEMGNFCTLPNLHDIHKFSGAVKPFWLIKLKKEMQNKGISQETYQRYLYNSFKLQRSCHKVNIEAARMSNNIKGYHVWTIVDYYGTTQGLLNMFLETKSILPEDFRKLNSNTAVLWKDSIRCYESNEVLTMKLMLSKYDTVQVVEDTVVISVLEEINILSEIIKYKCNVTGYGVIDLGNFDIRLPEVFKPKKLRIEVKLIDGQIVNDWEIWVFPKKVENLNYTDKISVSGELRYLLPEGEEIKDTIPEGTRIIIANKIGDSILDFINAGGKVLLIPEEDMFSGTIDRNTFKLSWWNPEDMTFHCANNLKVSSSVEDHPLLGDFPHEGYADLQFYYLIQLIKGIKMEKCPEGITPLIYDLTAELDKICFVFEVALGKGSLVVSTLNFSEAMINSHIEIKYIFDKMLQYLLACEPNKSSGLSIDKFKELTK